MRAKVSVNARIFNRGSSRLKSHCLPQRLVHPRLPARPVLAKLRDHIRIDPQRHLRLRHPAHRRAAADHSVRAEIARRRADHLAADDKGGQIERRRAATGIADIPGNGANLCTASNQALLRATADAGGAW